MKFLDVLIKLIVLMVVFSGYSQDVTVDIRLASNTFSEQIRGQYGVWYKNDICPNRDSIDYAERITKPFIICEGFDVDATLGFDFLYTQVDGNEGFLEDLRNDGYDIIILNLLDNVKSMSKNSFLLQKLIKEINETVDQNHEDHGTRIYRNTLLGVSMGGLISRHALCTMELLGEDHRVERFITHDSPNQGANVPLGVLNFGDIALGPLDDFNQIRSIWSATNIPDPFTVLETVLAPNLDGTLNTEAGQELAMNYPRINPNRSKFLLEMAILGQYPKGPRLMAIACGSNGQNMTNFVVEDDGTVITEELAPGDLLVNWEQDELCFLDESINIPLVGNVGVRACPFIFSARAYAMPGNGIREIARFNAGSEISAANTPLTPPTLGVRFSHIDRDLINAPLTRDFKVDHVPGSFINLGALGFDALESTLDAADIAISFEVPLPCFDIGVANICPPPIEVDVTLANNVLGSVEFKERFTFVPTVSALDINTKDWGYDIASIGTYPHNKDLTPFDAIYWNDRNTFHAQMEGLNMSEYAMQEVSPNDLYIQNRVFDSDYIHTFEARGIIALGQNVDEVENRTRIGNVIIKNGADITLSVEDDEPVLFEDGFEIEEGATLEVITNELGLCDKDLGTITDPIIRVANTTRRPSARTEESSERESSISIKETKEYQRYEKPEGVTSTNTFATYVFPSITRGDAKLRLLLPKKERLTISIFNSMGRKVKEMASLELFDTGSYDLTIPSSGSGVYIIKVSNNDNINSSMKFTVM